jgi:putative PIN family toxin of toxin-antitoxin system
VRVSAVINPYGTPVRVAEVVADDAITAVVTQHLLDELAGVLIRSKFRRWISVADAIAFVESLGGHADLRDEPGPPTTGVRDPNDDYLIALADAADAVIVTGDNDILTAEFEPPAPLSFSRASKFFRQASSAGRWRVSKSASTCWPVGLPFRGCRSEPAAMPAQEMSLWVHVPGRASAPVQNSAGGSGRNCSPFDGSRHSERTRAPTQAARRAQPCSLRTRGP